MSSNRFCNYLFLQFDDHDANSLNGLTLLTKSVQRLVATKRDETTCDKCVVLAALVNHAEVAFGRGFFVGNDSIELADFERSGIIRIIETDYKMNGFVFHITSLRKAI